MSGKKIRIELIKEDDKWKYFLLVRGKVIISGFCDTIVEARRACQEYMKQCD